MWIILAVFALLNVYVAIQASASGAKISQLTADETTIARDNQSLSSKVIELNSLKRLEKDAESLGFVKPGNIIYITGDAAVAKIP